MRNKCNEVMLAEPSAVTALVLYPSMRQAIGDYTEGGDGHLMICGRLS
jgi:hypothetical protein